VQKKSECLDLPPVSFTQIEIDFSGEEKKIYTRFYEERLKVAIEQRRTVLDEAKRNGEILTPEAEENALRVEAIAKDTFFRQAASLAKIKTAIEVAKDSNLSGAQALLFCAFKETAEQISKALECPCVTSDLAGNKRQKVVDDFQTGKHQNLVLTYGSGETGLNLQAASVVIRVDRVWLWASNEQSVARAHRIQQQNKVTVYDLFFGEHDKEMWKVLEAKTDNVLLLIGGERKEFQKVNLAEVKSALVKSMEMQLGYAN
jgi:SNF2 family DNA or RNA helicase